MYPPFCVSDQFAVGGRGRCGWMSLTMFGSSMSACDRQRICERRGRGTGVRRECDNGLAAASRLGSILCIASRVGESLIEVCELLSVFQSRWR